MLLAYKYVAIALMLAVKCQFSLLTLARRFSYWWIVPRKLRIQYPGAIYHVMNRADHPEDVFRGNADREKFLATPGEAGGKTQWRARAYCLMRNRLHLGDAAAFTGDNNGFAYGELNPIAFGNNPVFELSDTVSPFLPSVVNGGGLQTFMGAYYLRQGSPFLGVGTAGIDATLKQDLAQATTIPPEEFTQDVTSSMTISPTIPRENGDQPSLGYHYPAVDYVLNGATVNNCTLNIDQGTVLAFTPWWSYEWGLRLNPGGRLNVNGYPTNRVIFTRPDGTAFVADRVQHQTRLSADLNVAGALTVTEPSGQAIHSTPIAIALFDPDTGNTAIVAVVTNCLGALVSSNEVVYKNAFSGPGVCADVLYHLERGSLAQDVVLTGRLDPSAYGFPETSLIQIISEFFDTAPPQTLKRASAAGLAQAHLAQPAAPDSSSYTVTDGRGGYGTASITIDQADSDGDGMPDDWEIANGLDPFSDDSAELGADGLTHLAEFKLHTTPIATHNPLDLPDLGVVSGQLDVPLSISATLEATPGALCFLAQLDGDEAPAAGVTRGPDGTWHLRIDTTTLPNGYHLVGLGRSFHTQSGDNECAFGQPQWMYVYNPMTIDSMSTVFTTTLYIRAKLNVPAVAYVVTLYDVHHNSLQTTWGTPHGRALTAQFEMTDDNGAPAGDGPFECDISATSGGDAMAKAKPKYQRTNPISRTAKAFVVAYNRFVYPHAGDVITERVINCLRPSDGSTEFDYDLLPRGFNTPHSADAFEWIPGPQLNRKQLLMDALKDPRAVSFYWQGHGGREYIQPSRESHENIVAHNVLVALRNGLHDAPVVNNHAYRLVFLDACSTFSKDWADAFGIPFYVKSSKQEFKSRGLDYSAFVGFRTDTWGVASNDAHDLYGEALGALYGAWCFDHARLGACMEAFLGVLQGPGGSQLFWNYDSYDIAGCVDLTINDCLPIRNR